MKPSTRERILDTMYHLVYKNGYNNMGITELLNECHIPKGSLYHHFKSKKDIMICVIQERLSPYMDDLFNVKEGFSFDEITTTIDAISNNKHLILQNCPYNKINTELSTLDNDFKKELNVLLDKVIIRLQGHINDGIQKKILCHVNTLTLSNYILGTIWGTLNVSKSQEEFQDIIQHLYKYIDLLKI